jgi:hypothetical protein
MKNRIFLAVIALLLSACACTSVNDPGDPGTDQVDQAASRVVFHETRAGRFP